MKRLLTLIICVSIFTLPSCSEGGVETYYAYGNAMDTSVSVCVYGEYEKHANECLELLYNLEAELSVTASGSKLQAVNGGKTVNDDGHFYTLCGLANEVRVLTQGAYNPCIYPLVKLWGFTTGEYTVPNSDAIEDAIGLVNNSSIVFDDEGIYIEGGGQADFGGIAKGYAGNILRDYLKSKDVDAAIISLGGNIVTIGKSLTEPIGR